MYIRSRHSMGKKYRILILKTKSLEVIEIFITTKLHHTSLPGIVDMNQILYG